MTDTKISGTIRSLTDVTRRKKDVRMMRGKIVIRNEEGDSVSIESDPCVLDGFNPEDQVIVRIERAQKTLAESLPVDEELSEKEAKIKDEVDKILEEVDAPTRVLVKPRKKK